MGEVLLYGDGLFVRARFRRYDVEIRLRIRYCEICFSIICLMFGCFVGVVVFWVRKVIFWYVVLIDVVEILVF